MKKNKQEDILVIQSEKNENGIKKSKKLVRRR